MGVVLQAVELAGEDGARQWEAELLALRDAMARFEYEDAAPWSMDKVPPPLVAFGARYGVTWPLLESSRFLLRGSFAEAASVLRIDRLVLLWGDGFELGGETFVQVATSAGAVRAVAACHLRVPCDAPASRAAELASFLDDEDHAGHYSVVLGRGPLPEDALFSITFGEGEDARRLVFDGSGMQDWAFIAALPQLDGEDPRLAT